jgi:hypothetical protein
MSRKTLPMWLALIVLILAQLACGANTGIPVTGPDVVGTAAYATVNAQMTQQAFDNLALKLTQIAQVTQTPAATATFTPTNTLVPPTHTFTPTFTSTPSATVTNTPVPPTNTAIPIPCYRVQFISDVTVADGTTFEPGQKFTKTWRLMNNGSCTWTSDFDLVFISGNSLGASSVVDVNNTVTPGQTADFSVSLTAPSSEGTYTGSWELRSPSGVIFGLGPSANKAFWVKINVNEESSGSWNSSHKGDFIYNYCEADWKSSEGSLACSSSENFNTGSVFKVKKPVLEGGYKEDETALVTIPSDGDGGWITGTYPEMKVGSDKHFVAMIGCMNSSSKCDATLKLNYRIDGGSVHNLGSWQEKSDKKFHHISVDLADLEGEKVQFILRVNNNGDSNDDRIFWIAAAVQ